MRYIALIPARRGSKRVPGKNMAILGGKPLLQWTIEAAIESGSFDRITVSTDWAECLMLAEEMAVDCIIRPPELCRDASHDFEWVRHTLDARPGFDVFVILRPTSPFRTAETVKRAIATFHAAPFCDSMRAVERTTAHPRKSWTVKRGLMTPYEPGEIAFFPYFDLSTQALGEVYCQNGCIHVAWTDTPRKFGTVSGEKIKPFFTEKYEGVDINTPDDIEFAEFLIERGKI